MTKSDPCIRLDLNNPVFQENLLLLQKAERLAVLDTLNKIRRLTIESTLPRQRLQMGKNIQRQTTNRC